MCVMSMVMDHYGDKWQGYRQWPQPWSPPMPQITQDEVDEFRRLLERAREYDKAHNEPNCEMESKKERIRKLADDLGVKIDFL